MDGVSSPPFLLSRIMNILQIGNVDTAGQRFNGTDLHKQLVKRGIESQHCVWEKGTDDANTWKLAENVSYRQKALAKAAGYENKYAIQSLLYPFSWHLYFDGRFKKADLAHYHLIHTGYFSISALPALTRGKPSVWTLHDPWAMTGHCVYPFNCERWKTGCGKCPSLNIEFAVAKDNTAFMWKAKDFFYKHSKLNIVVASKWMLKMAEESPLMNRFNIHHIPYGLDLTIFKPANAVRAKLSLGINPDTVVLSFRATVRELKGLPYIVEALKGLNTDSKICLITFNEKNLLEQFKDKFQIIDLGWTEDTELITRAYNATDIFLMPSTAEAFGMMAAEAMACGKPVITFKGTSLPEVVFHPEGGVAVDQNVDALRKQVEELISDREMRERLGKNALRLAQEHYSIETYVDRHIALYENLIQNHER